MKLVVGLGNPGKKFAFTRHNVGFMVVEEILKDYSASSRFDKKSESIVYSLDKDRIVVKPQTFMNLSGRSVSGIVNFYKIPLENLLVVHDDVDLEFGEIKHQASHGSAGHNGVQSIIDNLGSNEFQRVRVGIGKPENPNIKTEDWVLQRFSEPEDQVGSLVQKASEIVINWLKD